MVAITSKRSAHVPLLTAESWRNKSNNSQVYAFTYEYDAVGNRTKMRRETTFGTEVESAYFAYAADNSLTKRRKQTFS
jgi:hypothetical protein